ncbi:MAG: F0F1 ATP synthase subunit A [Candidatus Zixiibacteriota bacterium]
MSAFVHQIMTLAAPTVLPLLSVASSTEEGGSSELPSLVGMLTHHEGPIYHWVNIIYALAVSVILCVVAVRVYAKRQMIPGPLQNVVEMAVEGMYNFLHSILGHEARRFVPFLGTLFFYILFMNLMGIVPLGHSPSTNINITASLAIMVFLYVQYIGVTRLGIVGYFDHLIGQPRDVIGWVIVPLIFPIHVIGEFAKPFSLALRLFGNITGEDILVAAFVGLGVMALGFIGSPVGLPFNVPFILLGLLLSTIQALVFTLLSTIYILMMLPHEEHH